MAKETTRRVEVVLKKYVLDTNSLIYALNGDLKIPQYDYVVSIITEIELLSYSKLTDDEEQSIKMLLSLFKSVSLSEAIKERTIDIRKHYNLKIPDSIIVATAVEENAVLVTSDKQLLKLDFLEVIELSTLV